MTEKRKPHYPLNKVKAAFADPGALNRTNTALQGADDLDLDDAEVVTIIQALSIKDFDKSMTSDADHTVWQDVYRPKVGGRALYVKFTLDTQKALYLISFKEA